MPDSPVRLTPSLRTKLWGVTDLRPWFAKQPEKTGEVWFVHDRPLPLLVKFLFTSERLSVQVHPDDDYARLHENSNGKTEMWRVLRAEPGAAIGIGFHEELSKERLREAALSGEIETLLDWRKVKAGDTFLIPAGTVHALGAGLVVCEIQQQSDVTYRLYDYGRPRELHLDRAVEVATPRPYPGASVPHPLGGAVTRLAECRHFITDLLDVTEPFRYEPDVSRDQMLVAIEGEAVVDEQSCRAGEAWLIPAGSGAFDIRLSTPARFLRTSNPK